MNFEPEPLTKKDMLIYVLKNHGGINYVDYSRYLSQLAIRTWLGRWDIAGYVLTISDEMYWEMKQFVTDYRISKTYFRKVVNDLHEQGRVTYRDAGWGYWHKYRWSWNHEQETQV